jgi:tRNA A-37 threonylcarbamoyl transferase component Bud32/membrane-associated phospholipid phosphatase
MAQNGRARPVTAQRHVQIDLVEQPHPERKVPKRRPSGEPPPLPRDLSSTGIYWLALTGLVVLAWLTVYIVNPIGIRGTRVDLAELRWIAKLRAPVLTDVMKSIMALGSVWTVFFLRWLMVLVLLFFKRFRHLFVFLGAALVVGIVVDIVAIAIARPRPIGIEILGSWEGTSHPSRPVAALAVTLMGIVYTIVPPGRPRLYAKWLTALLLLTLGFSRLYLAVDHPNDVIVAIILGVAVPLIAFRLFTPNDIFPVTYRRKRAAHLDVGGRRGEAIRKALEEQLGLTVLEIKPFGLAGSGGSTPMRIKVEGEPDTYLFAKLYARNHLRADRWYKIGRTLLYGRLEDEGSFSTVRRLVQYEDYLLRAMRDAGIGVPEPYGFAEITPEREYVLVTGFVDGAQELLVADVDDGVIDDSLMLVRKLWDAGIAHRDIKPSNILVKDGRVKVIDVAFGEIRPSPWRQAVDLANMMLGLAFRVGADRVYERALRFFTPEEIAEAFAATHGVTMPSQSRFLLKGNRAILARFRELAPHRRPISIQRWSVRRVGLTLAVLIGCLLGVGLAMSNLGGLGLFPVRYSQISRAPDCEQLSDQLVLMAQAVPSATMLPCLESLPVGWDYEGLSARNGKAFFFLNSDRAGFRSVEVTLTKSCDTALATHVPSDEPGTDRYERTTTDIFPSYTGTRFYLFEGGCAAYRFRFGGAGGAVLANDVSVGLGFFSRSELNESFTEKTGLVLSTP